MVGSPKSPTHNPDEAEDIIDMRRRELLGIIIAGVAWPLTGRTQQRREHMRELKLLREMAKGKDDIKAAIAAEVKRGELRQFYVKRVETGGPGAFAELNDEELQQAILEQTRELAELDPEFAKQLAQQKRATKH
jgi:hypothetical protein